MTTTAAPSKPGQYIFDYSTNRFVGRFNKDGTEDRRWVSGGSCSFLNTLLQASGGYTPKDPQALADGLLGQAGNGYVVNGYSMAVSMLTLTSEQWVQCVADVQTNEELKELFKHLTRDEERLAKADALAKLLRKEITARDLSELAEVTAADRLLIESQLRLAKEQQVQTLLRSLGTERVYEFINKRASDQEILDAAPSSATEFLEDWAASNELPLYAFLEERYEPMFSTIFGGLKEALVRLLKERWGKGWVGMFNQHAQKAARLARKDTAFLKNVLWVCYQRRKQADPIISYLNIYLDYVAGLCPQPDKLIVPRYRSERSDFDYLYQWFPYPETIACMLEWSRPALRGKGIVIEFQGDLTGVIQLVYWNEFKETYRKYLPDEVLAIECPYNHR